MGNIYYIFIFILSLSFTSGQQNDTDGQTCTRNGTHDIQCAMKKVDRLISNTQQQQHSGSSDLRRTIAWIKNQLTTQTQESNLSTIAFTASRDLSRTYFIFKGTVVFETVHYNQGNGYDSYTGVFTAPEEGTYVFSWTICVMEATTAGTHLMVNDRVVLKNWADARESIDDQDDTGSALAVVALNRSDRVWIEIADGTYIEGNGWSSFTGWRIFDSCC